MKGKHGVRMENLRKLLSYLDGQKIKYTVIDERRVAFEIDLGGETEVRLILYGRGETFTLFCWFMQESAALPLSKKLMLCNTLNENLRWVCFYVDQQQDISASMDLAYAGLENWEKHCWQQITRMAKIMAEASCEMKAAINGA